MQTLKVLSALLCYPQPEMHAALDAMASVLQQEGHLPEAQCHALQRWMQRMADSELLELQEEYVRLFDRGRALSLHIYEHVHGESRDRGQAMVNLLETYRAHGWELNARELPDYLPLFLEYLAQRPDAEALELLAEALHVIALLGERLTERGSDYQLLFAALTALVGEPADIADIRSRVSAEGPDPTLVNLDQIWEEEAVTFLANQQSCSSQRTQTSVTQTVQWMPQPSSTNHHGA